MLFSDFAKVEAGDIAVDRPAAGKAWMAGSSPAMTWGGHWLWFERFAGHKPREAEQTFFARFFSKKHFFFLAFEKMDCFAALAMRWDERGAWAMPR